MQSNHLYSQSTLFHYCHTSLPKKSTEPIYALSQSHSPPGPRGSPLKLYYPLSTHRLVIHENYAIIDATSKYYAHTYVQFLRAAEARDVDRLTSAPGKSIWSMTPPLEL